VGVQARGFVEVVVRLRPPRAFPIFSLAMS
jgi:hypothetical protein